MILHRGYIRSDRLKRLLDKTINDRNELIVRCERDFTIFTVIPQAYPDHNRKIKQSTNYCKTGDWLIDCPTCARGYFLEDDGQFKSDRPLTILKGGDLK